MKYFLWLHTMQGVCTVPGCHYTITPQLATRAQIGCGVVHGGHKDDPKDGHKADHKAGGPLNTVQCRVSCHPGHSALGSTTSTCTRDTGAWDVRSVARSAQYFYTWQYLGTWSVSLTPSDLCMVGMLESQYYMNMNHNISSNNLLH